jgi:CheY-like chemotaxis protein
MGAERISGPGSMADPAGLSSGFLGGETSTERAAILMVDDDPRNLFALEHALADLDADLIGAQNGTEALRQVLQRDFAVVILDVHMPGLDGYEVAEMMRKRERRCRSSSCPA